MVRTGRRGGEVTGTPGGARLRTLRESLGRTQLWVEAEAELGAGYLQRVECGRVAQPVRATVERILTALGARYGERREVLELFGYLVAAPLPDEVDAAWARDTSRREIAEAGFPAYVLDCGHRLIAWNRFVPPLLGIEGSDATLGGLAGGSLLAPWFDPDSALAALVAEPETFLPAQVRALRFEMQPFQREPWYGELFASLWQLPRFRRAWTDVGREPPLAGAARSLVPVRLAVPGAGTLAFRLTAERFTRDIRFRLIYFLPADQASIMWCARQAESVADLWPATVGAAESAISGKPGARSR